MVPAFTHGGWGDMQCCLFARERRASPRSRGELPDCHLVNQAERGLLLDMPGMKCDPGNLKAWISRYSYRIQLSDIKPALDLCKGTANRLFDRRCCCSADTAAGAGILQPHEMPSSVSDSLIQNGGCHIFNRHPRFAESLLPERESVGQDTPLAEKHRIRFHA